MNTPQHWNNFLCIEKLYISFFYYWGPQILLMSLLGKSWTKYWDLLSQPRHTITATWSNCLHLLKTFIGVIGSIQELNNWLLHYLQKLRDSERLPWMHLIRFWGVKLFLTKILFVRNYFFSKLMSFSFVIPWIFSLIRTKVF